MYRNARPIGFNNGTLVGHSATPADAVEWLEKPGFGRRSFRVGRQPTFAQTLLAACRIDFPIRLDRLRYLGKPGALTRGTSDFCHRLFWFRLFHKCNLVSNEKGYAVKLAWLAPLNLRHVVVLNCSRVTIIPIYRNACPTNFNNGALVGHSPAPENTVERFEKSGLIAGHWWRVLTAVIKPRLPCSPHE
jgi:hypothetical protein